MIIEDHIKLDVIHYLFSSAYADALEGAGGGFPSGSNICDVAPRQDDATMLPIINQYLDDLAAAYEMPVHIMIYDVLQLDNEDDIRRMLELIFMSWWGHGIGPSDDFNEVIDAAEEREGRDIDLTPGINEYTELIDLAYEVVQDELMGDNEVDDDSMDGHDYSRGDRVRVEEAHMPTGETLSGYGNLHRLLDERKGKWVIRMEEETNPPGYTGTLVVVHWEDWELD